MGSPTGKRFVINSLKVFVFEKLDATHRPGIRLFGN